MTDHHRDTLASSARELMASGTPPDEAWSLANMKEAMRLWPAAWGDELEVLIGGDFEPPKADLVVPSLGITVFREKLPNGGFCGALSVVRARIAAAGRDIVAYNDAIRRLNVLLGSHAVASWGASGLRWWCWIWGAIRGARVDPFCVEADTFSRHLGRLPQPARGRIEAALYWLREPRSHLGENRPDAVRAFASYWTAFECLVTAGCDLAPMMPSSDEAIQRAIAEVSDGETLRRAYRLVQPTLADRARHVFAEFLPGTADQLIEECFTRTPRERRLADIRNSISHGGVRAEDLDSLAILGAAEGRLRRVVWPLLHAILERGRETLGGSSS